MHRSEGPLLHFFLRTSKTRPEPRKHPAGRCATVPRSLEQQRPHQMLCLYINEYDALHECLASHPRHPDHTSAVTSEVGTVETNETRCSRSLKLPATLNSAPHYIAHAIATIWTTLGSSLTVSDDLRSPQDEQMPMTRLCQE